MKVLDLGSGTGSATNIWKMHGHEVVTVDYNIDFKPTICGDYSLDTTWNKINERGPYEFIWFSPDCRYFSLAGSMPFNERYEPITQDAHDTVVSIVKALGWIKFLKPRLGWIMENPRALMRKMDWVKDLQRVTVTYCQYGDDRMKPTDLFGQIPIYFIPKKCNYNDKCHVSAPRGSRTGSQGLGNAKLRAMIPFDLTKEIYEAAIKSDGEFIPTLKKWYK